MTAVIHSSRFLITLDNQSIYVRYVIRAHVCGCGMDAKPLFLGVLFNRYFYVFMLPVLDFLYFLF